MRKLSSYLSEEKVLQLKEKISHGEFPGLSLQNAMLFVLSDGVLPESDLPVDSFLKLEDWLRGRTQDSDKDVLTFTTTELKNKTGEILDQVLSGRTVCLTKHGRRVARLQKDFG